MLSHGPFMFKMTSTPRKMLGELKFTCIYTNKIFQSHSPHIPKGPIQQMSKACDTSLVSLFLRYPDDNLWVKQEKCEKQLGITLH
jgi:hypothetical protein